MIVSEDDKKRLAKDGYILIKNVFSKEEINFLRDVAENFFSNPDDKRYVFSGIAKPDVFNYVDDLSVILENDKVKSIVKTVCDGNPKYAHLSDLHKNVLSSWHKDNYWDQDWETIDGQTYQCYKLLIYLQDHSDNKQGLTVKPGSHLSKDVNAGEPVYIKTNAGDVLLFDLRINHAGHFPNKLQKVLTRLVKDGPLKYNILSFFRKTFGIQNKFLLQFSVGKPSQFLSVLTEKSIKRQNAQNGISDSQWRFNPVVKERLEKAEIEY